MSDGTYSLGAISRRAAIDQAEARDKADDKLANKFFAQASKDDPAAAAAAYAKFPTLTDRQLQRRHSHEARLWESAGYDSHGNRLIPTRLGKPDRRLRVNRPPRPLKLRRRVGRPRGDLEAQAERKRQYNRARRAALRERVGN